MLHQVIRQKTNQAIQDRIERDPSRPYSRATSEAAVPRPFPAGSWSPPVAGRSAVGGRRRSAPELLVFLPASSSPLACATRSAAARWRPEAGGPRRRVVVGDENDHLPRWTPCLHPLRHLGRGYFSPIEDLLLLWYGMDLEQHADNMGGNSSGGRQAVWTTAMSSFVLQFMANLVASGTRASNGFKQVHLKSCARALNERFRLQVTAAQISNHLRKWKRIWAKVNKLKSLSGAHWDEHTCTIVLDHEHYTSHVKDHHSDADLLNTPIEHYHEMATICGSGVASGVYARSSNEPLAIDVTENVTENGKTNGGSDRLATGVEEAVVSSTNTGGNIGDSPGSLPAPKKAKMSHLNLSQQCDAPAGQPDTAGSHGINLEQQADNMGNNNGGGGLAVWTNAMSSFVLQFLANLVASGTRPSHCFKQVHLKSCAQALTEHFRVQVTAAQISNHLRKWKRKWAKVNKLKSLSGALWDDNTCTIVLDHEHYTGHVKDHRNDADFLNTPIEHYHEMATIFINRKASAVHAKSSSEPRATDVTENRIENEKMNGGSDPLAKGVEEAAMSFTNTKGGNIGDSSGSLPPPKKAKVSNDDTMLRMMICSLDNLAKAIEKSSTTYTDVPEDLWDNMMDLPGFEEAHLTHYYAHLCENVAVARAFNKLSVSNKMIWVTRYVKNHLSG